MGTLPSFGKLGDRSSLLKTSRRRWRSRKLGPLLLLVIMIIAAGFGTSQHAQAAPGPITGSVFNDENVNGARDAGEGAFGSLAIINVYSSSGSYIKSRTSDSSGNYSVSGLAAGTYYLTVYNTGRNALLDVAPGLINTIGAHVEPTYASVGVGAGGGSGPVCASAAPDYVQRANYASSPSEWQVGAQNGTSAGPCFGGRRAAMTNTLLTTIVPPTFIANNDYTSLNTSLNNQKLVSKVVLTNSSGVSNADFGLSANAVTHANSTGQGSLRQFIENANLIAGGNMMRFVPSVATNQGSGANAWWQIDVGGSALPTITGALTTLDGRAFSNTNGSSVLNTNTGTLNGPVVGTDQYDIPEFNKPELELLGDPRAGLTTSLLRTTTSGTTIGHFGMNSNTNYPGTLSYFTSQSDGVGVQVHDNVVGVNMATGADYSTRPQFAMQTSYTLPLAGDGIYRHNYMSSNDRRGLLLAGGLLGAGNVQALLLGDWLIEENAGPSAGVAFGAGVTRIQVRRNHMPELWLDAGPLNVSVGIHTVTENTITGGNGVRLSGGLQNTITRNVITNATGSNPGITVGNLSTGNFMSRNSFSGNGGNAIDLNADGVSETNLLNCLTLGPGLVTLANLGIARPTIEAARLNGPNLSVDIGYCGVGVYNVELYRTASGSGDGSPAAGEGQTHLGTLTDLALINGTVLNQTLPVSGLQPGDSVSALVVNMLTGDTSEFSVNTTVGAPPAAPASAPDMTAGTDSGASNTDNTTSDPTPTFVGTCTNGETVTLYLDGQAIAPTQVCSGGTYSITPSVAIAEGAHNLATSFTNGSGTSGQGPVLAFVIDTSAPTALSAPDLVAASDSGSSDTDNVTSDTTPTLTGTCTNGTAVNLYQDEAVVATAACGGGSYSFTLSSALADGQYVFRVTATDTAGNESGLSPTLAVTIDTTAPGAPALTAPANNMVSNDATPTFEGTGVNGATVTVHNQNGNALCSAVVSSGTWQCTPTSPLAEGVYTATATQTDAAGNVSAASAARTVTIDTTPPGAPVISTPATGTVTNDTTPTITGTAQPNASLRVRINGGPPATVTADGNGNWTYTPDALSDGQHNVIATQLDAAGNVSAASNEVEITVDTIRPSVTINSAAGQADPTTTNVIAYAIVFSEPINSGTFTASDFAVVSSPTSSAPSVTQLTQLNPTTWEARVTGAPNNTTVSLNLPADRVQDTAGNQNAMSTSTDNSVTYSVGSSNVTALITNDTTPTIEGQCIANHELTITVDGATYVVTCSSNGDWERTLPVLAEGTYDVIVHDDTADVTNPPGNQNDALIIDTTAPSLTLNSAAGQADPTNVNLIRYELTFSEPINASTLAAGDFSVVGAPGASVQNLSQLSPTVWRVEVVNLTSGQTVSLSLPAGRVTDAAGNQNTASSSTDNSVTYDTTAPATPDLTAPADNIVTQDATPTFSGTGENGAVVSVLVDGSSIACTQGPLVVASGTWSCTPASPVAQGVHSWTARQADPAGNLSADAAARTFTIDGTPPATPSAPDLLASSDTGISDTDNITSDNTLTLVGSCAAGETARIYEGAQVRGEAECSSGTYSVTLPALANGEHEFLVSLTDAAGNASAYSPALLVVIDTQAPAAVTITNPTTGSTLTDSTPAFAGTGEPGAWTTVRANGQIVACNEGSPFIVPTNGEWTCTADNALMDDEYTLEVVQVDDAGNQSAPSSISFTIDTTAPPEPGTPDLIAASDSGVSNADNLTNDTTPTFTGTCTNDQTIRLWIDDQIAASDTCIDGSYTLTASPALSEGAHGVQVTELDSAGNESVASPVLTITVDTTSPVALTAPDLTAATDRGFSSTDNITNDETPTFVGSCVSGQQVGLYEAGQLLATTICDNGAYSLVPSSPLSDGAHQLSTAAADAAGNQSSQSATLSITIDITTPASATYAAPADQSVLGDNTPTLSGTGEAGARLTITANGVTITCDEANPLVIAGNGSWVCAPGQPLADNEYTIAIAQTDVAGNQSAPANRTVTVDTTPPDAPDAPDLLSASDSGVSNTDNLTNNTAPVFTGACQNGDTIRLYAEGQLVASGTCANNAYALAPGSSLGDGAHAITVTAVDGQQNESSPSTVLNITIDTTTPAAPGAPDMTTATDTGFSSTDNLTSNVRPAFMGTCTNGETTVLRTSSQTLTSAACSGGTYQLTLGQDLTDGSYALYVVSQDAAGNQSAQSSALSIVIDTAAPTNLIVVTPANQSETNDTTPTLTGSGTAEARLVVAADGTPIACSENNPLVIATDGTWICTLISPLADGQHELSVTQTDPAGNQSAAVTRTITTDTTAPAAPAAPDLLASSDSGVSNTDNLTNDTTPIFTGSCTGNSLMRLYINGQLRASQTCANGVYTLTSTTLASGSVGVTVTASDSSGNESSASSSLSIVIDTQAPDALTAPDLTAATDTGISSTDNLTSQTLPHFVGSCQANDTIRLTIDGVSNGQTDCINGAYDVVPQSSVAAGVRQVSVIATDRAGNTGEVSLVLVITIDTTAPAAPAITAPAQNTSTNNTSPTFSGTGVNGSTIIVRVDGSAIACTQGSAVIVSGGTWACTPTTPLSEGMHGVSAVQSDPAGNSSSASTALAITIDTTAPATLGQTDLSDGSDTGNSNTDNLTNNQRPIFTGTCENGTTIRLFVSSTQVGQTTCANGTYSVQPTSNVSEGQITVVVSAVDPAGNSSPASPALAVGIDTTAPTVLLPDLDVNSDSGVSSTDNITNVSLPTITGTCTDGSMVHLYVDGVTATMGECFPPYYIKPASNLSQGNHAIRVTETDPAGNTSPLSVTLTITIDNMAPPNPTVLVPAANTNPTVRTATYTTSGTSQAGVTLHVSENNAPVCTTTVQANGSWSCTLTNLTNGQHTYRYRASDTAGNSSANVTMRTITVAR